MMRRVLIKEPVKEEPSQRRSLFRIKCKIMGKVCRVVVDSGSTDIIVSEESVSKLNLQRILHSDPYRVTSLNKGQHVLVNEQTWVEFTIGGYKDKILCEILPMDACHVLLGRPWQFGRKAIHHGEKNSYTFQKDGVTYKIQSIGDQEERRSKGSNVLLVVEKEFIDTLKEGEGEGFSLVVKPKEKNKDKQVCIPNEVQQILNQFQDIISDGTPATLPPKRAISHEIDFIPKASLPNKAAYKMTPEQNKEIAKQIQELLDNGLIRKSINPCVVPTILAPKKGGTCRLCIYSRAIN
ncbi:hypothetical protein SUGI_0545990 [Cryptomeria japonica]|nr:hypothetical protein SUGI_0545990 [Cryptomeria japonica]